MNKIILVLILITNNTYAQENNTFKSDLSVVDSIINHIKDEGYTFHELSTIGHIVNKSNKNYENIVLEIEFFDKTGKLIDTATKKLYENVFPSNNRAAFKVLSNASKKMDLYASHKIRILDAKIKKSCKSHSKFRQFLSDYGGLLFILFWFGVIVYSSYKYQKEEKANRKKFLDIANHQSEEIKKISLLLELISKK